MSSTDPFSPARAPRNEREYLQQQAALAQRALKRVGHQVLYTASGQTSLTGCIEKHPLLSLGVATVGGAVLGRWLAGSRKRQDSDQGPSPARRRLGKHLSSFYQTVLVPPLRAAMHQIIAQISHGFVSQQMSQQDQADQTQSSSQPAAGTGPASVP